MHTAVGCQLQQWHRAPGTRLPSRALVLLSPLGRFLGIGRSSHQQLLAWLGGRRRFQSVDCLGSSGQWVLEAVVLVAPDACATLRSSRPPHRRDFLSGVPGPRGHAGARRDQQDGQTSFGSLLVRSLWKREEAWVSVEAFRAVGSEPWSLDRALPTARCVMWR